MIPNCANILKNSLIGNDVQISLTLSAKYVSPPH